VRSQRAGIWKWEYSLAVRRLSRLKGMLRRRPRATIACSVIVGGICVWAGYEFSTGNEVEKRYRAAVAEADRLDPGWRDGIRPSIGEPIPDDENSANLVAWSSAQIPRGWESSVRVWWMFETDPARRVRPETLAELRQHRDEAKDALADVRALADRPRGHFSGLPVEVPHSYPLVTQQITTVLCLLSIDALIHIEEGDLVAAATNVKGMVNAGRSIDEHPILAYQVARRRAVVLAAFTLERLLAHGELPEPVLTDLQNLLTDEARYPLALDSLRGGRAADEKLFNSVRDSRRGAASLVASPGAGRLAVLYTLRTIRENQTRALELNNRLVELGKLPVEQQGPAFKASSDQFFTSWQKADILTHIYTIPFHDCGSESLDAALFQSQHHTSANVAVLALASERFRLAHGRWPASAEELVPEYLSVVPYDPHTGGPLKYRRKGKQLIIYSAGEDATDDGGIWTHNIGTGLGRPDEGLILDASEDRVFSNERGR
jgi:hypothetical protein